MLDQKR